MKPRNVLYGVAVLLCVLGVSVYIGYAVRVQLIESFACGYSYGTRDAVAFASPALALRPEIQPGKQCYVFEQRAHDAGLVRIVPR